MKTEILSYHNCYEEPGKLYFTNPMRDVLQFTYASKHKGYMVITGDHVYFTSRYKKGTVPVDMVSEVFNTMLVEEQPYVAESPEVPYLQHFLKPYGKVIPAVFQDGILTLGNVRISRSEVELDGKRRPITDPLTLALRLLTKH